ncbi:MAG: hypothetical protein ABIH83_00495 [Candidatus Micrarchaeota archaeon]
MRNMNGKIVLFGFVVFLLCFILNASYIVHLVYENGEVRQENVYQADDVPVPDATSGEYEVQIGNYEGNFSFPLWTFHDPRDVFDEEGQVQVRTPQYTQMVKKKEFAEEFIVVPEAGAGSNLVVRNETNILLDELLKQPEVINVVSPPVECFTNEECEPGVCMDGKCMGGEFDCCLLPLLGIAFFAGYILFVKKKDK